MGKRSRSEAENNTPLSLKEEDLQKKAKKSEHLILTHELPLEIENSKDEEIARKLKADRKAARKASKVERKLSKEYRSRPQSHSATTDSEVKEQIAAEKARKEEKARRKAARKLEKAQIKASKEVVREATHRTSDYSTPIDSENQTSSETPPIFTPNLQSKNESLATTPDAESRTTSDYHIYEEHDELSKLPHGEITEYLTRHQIEIHDPLNATLLYRPIISFSYLPFVRSSASDPFASFKSPTPIQAASWPPLLKGRDMIGIAETGSGKTFAFGVPCINYLLALPKSVHKKGARALIISPTRELACQIRDQLQILADSHGQRVACIYGGVPKDTQYTALKTANIIVATPGRLNDLVNEGAANLGNVQYLVLDEADRMLEKGFEEEIRKIIGQTKASSRQTLMFTATWPPSVRELAMSFMRDPVKITIGDNHSGELRANARIEQIVEVIDPKEKQWRLLQLLKQHQSGKKKDDRILVFCLYKKEATRIEEFIRSKGFRVAGIHGDLPQSKRTASLELFKNGTVPILVATDVAARGLDIPAVKVVINVTFPLTAEDYVHRIGR
jgi:ATP-dependent RNA helicase DBP3